MFKCDQRKDVTSVDNVSTFRLHTFHKQPLPQLSVLKFPLLANETVHVWHRPTVGEHLHLNEAKPFPEFRKNVRIFISSWVGTIIKNSNSSNVAVRFSAWMCGMRDFGESTLIHMNFCVNSLKHNPVSAGKCQNFPFQVWPEYLVVWENAFFCVLRKRFKVDAMSGRRKWSFNVRQLD